MKNEQFAEDAPCNDYDWEGVVDPITLEQAQGWIAALKSGNYHITTGQLKRDEDYVTNHVGICHCVLGVYAEEHNLLVETDNQAQFLFKDKEQGSSGCLEANDISYILPIDMQSAIFAFNDAVEVSLTNQEKCDRLVAHLTTIFSLGDENVSDS